MKNEIEVNLMSPLVWAYVGDSVYELFIRSHLVETTKLKPHKLHIESIKHVKARGASKYIRKVAIHAYRKRKRDSKKNKKYRKPSSTKKCKFYRLYVCNSFWRINWVFVFNWSKRKTRRNTE